MGNIFKSIRAQSAQGLAIKDDGNNTAIFIEDGGQVGIGGSTAPAAALDITGQLKKSQGFLATYSWQNSSDQTQNTVFDNLSPFIPNTNDEMIISGGIVASATGHILILSSAKRTGSTTIVIYGIRTDGANETVTCANGSGTNAFGEVSLTV